MKVEGIFFGATAFVGIIFYVLIMLCLRCSLSSRKHKVYDAVTHLIRAGEALTESSSTLLRKNSADPFVLVRGNTSGDNSTATDTVDGESSVNISEPLSHKDVQRVSKILSKAGKTLQDAGYALIQPENERKNSELPQPASPGDSQATNVELPQPASPGDSQATNVELPQPASPGHDQATNVELPQPASPGHDQATNFELQQPELSGDEDVDDAKVADILGRFTKVIEIVTIAHSALSDAGNRLKAVAGGKSTNAQNTPSEENKFKQVGEIIEQAGNCLQTNSDEDFERAGVMLCKAAKNLSELNRQSTLCSSCSCSCRGICNKIGHVFPFLLYSLYRLVFRHSVEEVTLPGPGNTTRREYLFGGYRIPKNPHLLHAYYLAMLVTVANWFFVMFFDTAFYRKTTTCNDLNVRRDAYLCFDVSQSILAGPVNCIDPTIRDDLDIYVLCYLQFFNFPVALSLSFSFAQLMILLIHISFALTLWCVKNFKPYAALALHAILLALYIIGFTIYGPFVCKNIDDVQYKGLNIFYGDRILRIFMVILGGVTLFLLTLLSPYWWLIDKHYREHRPTYSSDGKKDV